MSLAFLRKLAMLRVENIVAKYYKKEILRGVSLEVQAGEIVVLLGNNGSGKSTLLKVIAGLLKPVSGQVFLDGKEITNLPPHLIAKRGVGYLMQDANVFTDLTVEENIAIAGRGFLDGFDSKSVDKALVSFPQLQLMKRKRAGLLSGGEKKMLALSMIFMRHPRVLLLDEPTAGLALDLRDAILGTFTFIKEQKKVAIFLVEQNIQSVLKVQDRFVQLYNGRVTSILKGCVAQGK